LLCFFLFKFKKLDAHWRERLDSSAAAYEAKLSELEVKRSEGDSIQTALTKRADEAVEALAASQVPAPSFFFFKSFPRSFAKFNYFIYLFVYFLVFFIIFYLQFSHHFVY
jgi:hypothetical protein